jgi:hypothetical protein
MAFKTVFFLFLFLLTVLSYTALKPATSWQLRAWCGPAEHCSNGTVNGKIMVDVDLFDTSAAEIATLVSQSHVVICYFSAGSLESYRPDANTFPASLLGLQMDGWDETWLDIRDLAALQPIMAKRIALAKSKGCNGIEPDNVDCWANNCVNGVDAEDDTMGQAQLVYNKWLAAEAHGNGLSIGLKNDLDQVDDLVNSFDWAINEECFHYDECDGLNTFINNGKAVFNVEYTGNFTANCAKAKVLKFSSKYDVNGMWVDC